MRHLDHAVVDVVEPLRIEQDDLDPDLTEVVHEVGSLPGDDAGAEDQGRPAATIDSASPTRGDLRDGGGHLGRNLNGPPRADQAVGRAERDQDLRRHVVQADDPRRIAGLRRAPARARGNPRPRAASPSRPSPIAALSPPTPSVS